MAKHRKLHHKKLINKILVGIDKMHKLQKHNDSNEDARNKNKHHQGILATAFDQASSPELRAPPRLIDEMLSRRDKLLIQPWEDRRFKDHRSKVKSALPTIDDSAPASRPHVAVKLKKCQRELDRKHKIQRDNFSLLQRLNAIMRVNRLDNHWPKPLPNFQQKVGLFYDAVSLNSRLTERSFHDDTTEPSYSNVKCYACEVKKRNYEFKAMEVRSREGSLPSIF